MAIVAGAGIAAAGAVGSSVISSNASSSAASQQAAAAGNASATELNMFNTTQANLQPYMSAGTNALSSLQGFLGLGGQSFGQMTGAGAQNFTFNPSTDPEYQFMLTQGLGAITNQASALGGVNSGATLQALSNYGQQSAQSAYQTEFNNWNTTLNNIFSRLTGVTQLGQTSAAGVGNAALTTGQSVGNNIIGAGNAQAAGTVGSANAFSSGLQSIFNSPAFTNLLTNNSSGSGAGGLVGGQNALNFANSTSDPIGSLAASQGW